MAEIAQAPLRLLRTEHAASSRSIPIARTPIPEASERYRGLWLVPPPNPKPLSNVRTTNKYARLWRAVLNFLSQDD